MEPNHSEAYKKLDALLTARSDWEDVFTVLNSMDKNAIDNYRTKSGNPLLFAAASDYLIGIADISVIKKLLGKYKVNPDIMNENETTPLMLACGRKNIPLITLLLQYGADPDIEDYRGRNSFRWSEYNPQIFDLLEKYKK